MDLVVPNTLISRDSVSGMNPYLKEMFIGTFIDKISFKVLSLYLAFFFLFAGSLDNEFL